MAFKVTRAAQTDECIPRGVNGSYDPAKGFTFQILNWEAFDEGPVSSPEEGDRGRLNRCFDEERKHTIYISGSTSSGNGVTVRTTFEPYFLLKLERIVPKNALLLQPPRKWSAAEIRWLIDTQLMGKEKFKRLPEWYRRENPDEPETEQTTRYYQVFSDPDNADEDERQDSKVFLSYESAFCGWEEQQLKDLDAGFTVDVEHFKATGELNPLQFQYIKLRFTTLAAMQACARRARNREVTEELQRKQLAVSVYEANLPPHIRMMHLTGVQAAGWARCSGNRYQFVEKNSPNRKTRSQIEIELPKWQDLKPVVNKEEIARFRQASVDLETYSPDDAKFSTPELVDNYIIQIATTITDFGQEDATWRVLYVLHGIDVIDEPRTIVVRFSSERAMLLAWLRLIQNSDPDLVHAYNGWEFDYGYLGARAKVCGCWEQFRHLGRLINRPSQLVEKTMSSGAYGDNHWKLLPMSGRLVIDPLVHIKREHNLTSYSLKAVSEHFLSKKMAANPLSITEGSRTVTVRHAGHKLEVGKVVHFSDIDTPDIERVPDDADKLFYALAGWSYEDLHGDQDPNSGRSGLHVVTRVINENAFEFEMASVATKTVNAAGGKGVKIFETKHDISFPAMFKAFREQDTATMRDVGRYCIQDTLLPQYILNQLCVLPNLIEMAKVTWVPIEYLITRGQQIKVFSQLCKVAHEHGWAVPTVERKRTTSVDDEDDDDDDDEEGYVGGAVLDPFIGFFDEPIAVPDFASLYPTTMIDGNYCYTTLVKDDRFKDIPGIQYNYVDVGEGRQPHIFVMNYDGIVPLTLVQLLNARDRRKKQMGAAKTPLEYMTHNGAQLALKVSANSIYGFTGVAPEKSILPCMAIAESTTAQGRRSTFTSRDYIENPENFRDIVQCDTHFPLNYPYLMKNLKKGGCFHMTAKKLLDMYRVSIVDPVAAGEQPPLPALKEDDVDRTPWRYLPVCETPAWLGSPEAGGGELTGGVLPIDGARYGLGMWTTASADSDVEPGHEWAAVTGVSRVHRPYIAGDLIRIHTDKGTTLDMQNLRERVLNPVNDGDYKRSVDVPDAERTVDTARRMVKKNFCVTVYGDTDSIFTFFDASHLEGQAMRVVWCSIVSAFCSDRITQYLRSLNRFKRPEHQWMALRFEKTYRFWILFSKKRYAGEMSEADPFSYIEDKKGVALKRRDFCSFVKETYSKILKAIFNPDDTVTRDQRIHNALAVVRRAVEDLLNNRVPFDKLIISKLLKDHYKVQEKKSKKQTKKAQTGDFGPHNIYVDDMIQWQMQSVTCKGIVTEKRGTTISAFFGGGPPFGGGGGSNKKAAAAVDTRPPLTVKITKVIADGSAIPHTIAPKTMVLLNYADITARGASVIHLSKILDPNTPTAALEPITFPHVRLARRMYLRDPATAPQSGSRVPYVFCEPDDIGVLQYLRAENPQYAQSHGMKIDPVYYLEKQCANAWGQILDTACPGLVQSVFGEAYDLYQKRVSRQPELMAYLSGSHMEAMKRIALSAAAPNVEQPSLLKRKPRYDNAPKPRKKAAIIVGQSGQTSIASFFAAPPPAVVAAAPAVVTNKRVAVRTNDTQKRSKTKTSF